MTRTRPHVFRHHARRTKVAALALAIAVVGVGSVTALRPSAAGTTNTVTARGDAYVTSNLPWLNTGSWGFTLAGVDNTAATYLQFPAVAAGFERAVLRVKGPSAASVPVTVNQVTGSWSESSLTWDTSQRLSHGPVLAQAKRASDGWTSLEVTSALRSAPAGASFRVQAKTSDWAMFATRESGGAPQLVLTYPGASTTTRPATTTAPTTTRPAVTTAAPTTTRPATTTAAPTTVAPVTTRPPTTTAAPTTTVAGSGHPGVAVDASRIPVGDAGWSGPIIGAADHQKTRNDIGAFRINCRYSHMRFDDPIVFPGRSGASHLHTFFGNTAAAAASTPSSILNSGNSTCSGGTANRSAYWAPSIIDTRTGEPVVTNATETDRDNHLQVYYKTGYDGVLPGTVQNFPVGLRMIAGSATSTAPQARVMYSCGAEGAQRPQFGTCAPGELLVMSITFPQCWDGVNLDSPDHKSHMAYGAGWPDKGCPATHPVPLAQITQNYRYRVPAGGMSTWRLSSDMYTGPAGYSGHADWMNGWDPAVFQRVVDNCYRGSFDCSMNLLGDGQKLL